MLIAVRKESKEEELVSDSRTKKKNPGCIFNTLESNHLYDFGIIF